jgi:hypothetical protein
MKKISYLYMFLFSLIFILTGCANSNVIYGNGILKRELRSLSEFEKIVANGNYTLKVICKPQHSVSIKCDENIVEYVKTEIQGGTLQISTPKEIRVSKNILVEISVPKLKQLTINGAGEVEIENIDNEKLEIVVNSSGTIMCKGKTKDLNLLAYGSSDFDTKSLSANHVKIDVSGSTKAVVAVNKSIDVKIIGSYDIKYFGNPDKVSQKISGSGSFSNGSLQVN